VFINQLQMTKTSNMSDRLTDKTDSFLGFIEMASTQLVHAPGDCWLTPLCTAYRHLVQG
jgi:hypothetical protein